ncbi:MAG: S-adenosylmethionine:tRNA ribosyltransferase-isomerase, partial [Micromonosporaceae bacterium]|jgi:S-adenosylmethionine:tRNA ribosyltransferase-isomerase|nr:S-adenosylmethionine:tRNA ribosyltransferase-isomerase [Micromonosporaceae bacterium]
MSTLTFDVPPELEASAPPARRDGVRLLVASSSPGEPDRVRHATFGDLPDFLSPGDVVVVNTSATVPAAVRGRRGGGQGVTVHFSTALDDGSWLVELRPPGPTADGPLPDVRAGERVLLPDGVALTVIEAEPAGQRRLWRAGVDIDGPILAYLVRHGRAIRYRYVPYSHPLTDYQTVFGREAGSAEMPSAGRPFTDRLVTELVARGIGVAPVLLHTGVSSQVAGEPPLPERYAVSAHTARQVESARRAGGRVVAVGTTVTRALETAADGDGVLRASAGWTDLVLGPDRPARVVTGLITGWHAPGASHLQLLAAVAGADLVRLAYAEALADGYRWHEFGDSCLLLPTSPLTDR